MASELSASSLVFGDNVKPVERSNKNTYTAEVGLRAALAKPRNSHKTVKLEKTKLPNGPDGEPITIEDMPEFRVDRSLERDRAEKAELDLVQSLPTYKDPPPQPESGFAKLDAAAKKRKTLHDAEFEEYHEWRTELYEQLEADIRTCGLAMKADVEKAQNATADLFKLIEQDETLLRMSHADVRQAWENLEKQCQERTAVVSRFKDSLDDFENRRASEYVLLSPVLVQLTHGSLESKRV